MTQSRLTLSAQSRTALGKKSRHLRKNNLIPANIFGNVQQSMSIQINSKEFFRLYSEAGESSVIYVTVAGDNQEHPVLISEVQRDPRSQQPIHVSLRQVNLKEKVTADIEIRLVGELTVSEATPVLVKDVIEVEALPTDLPEAFEIDLSKFTEIGQEVLVKELPFDPTKVELAADLDEVVLQIQKIEQMAEEEESTPVSETEGEAGSAEAPTAEEAAPASDSSSTQDGK